MAKLTSDQQNKKLVIEQYRKASIIAGTKLMVEINTCEHFIIAVAKAAVCDICATYFGWWCPNSADHICEYNGVKDPAHDSCIYCGCPEERK